MPAVSLVLGNHIPKMQQSEFKLGTFAGILSFFERKIIMERHLRLCIWFFIGYWILKTGWISILALFFVTNFLNSI
jgi:hypothetical protein